MAYTSKQFFRDLAIYSTGAAVGAKNSAKFATYAAKKGIQLAGVGVARAAPAVATTAAANPFIAGTALGLGALATPPGQALLDAAAVRGAADRIAAQQAYDEAIFRATELPKRQLESAIASPVFKPAVKRKVSKYSKAVKSSKFIGKKGTISNAKTAFKSVNLVASAVNRGKKVANKGVRGVIARAVRKIL